MNTNEAGKTTFLFLQLSGPSRFGGREGETERKWERKRERKCEGGRNFLMQSSRLQGTGFPKVPNQGPSSAIFPLLFPSRRRNQFVITLCMPQCSRQPYNLQLWGLLGGRDGVREKERERVRERGGATGWRKEGVKKTQEVASSKEEKRLSACSCICLHPLIKGINARFFSLPHSSEMRSLSVILVRRLLLPLRVH